DAQLTELVPSPTPDSAVDEGARVKPSGEDPLHVAQRYPRRRLPIDERAVADLPVPVIAPTPRGAVPEHRARVLESRCDVRCCREIHYGCGRREAAGRSVPKLTPAVGA